MRILQLHSRHSSVGGADRVVSTEATALIRGGMEVKQYLTTPVSVAGGRFAPAVEAIWNRDAQREVDEKIRDWQPDVVHLHTPFPGLSLAPIRTARSHGVPVVWTMHSFRSTCVAGTLIRDGRECRECVGSSSKLPAVLHGCYHQSRLRSAVMASGLAIHRAVRTVPDLVDLYLPLTEGAGRILGADGVPSSKIRVKPNFLLDRTVPVVPTPSSSPYVVFAGRLVPEKGVDTLIAAARKLRESGNSLRIVVAGDGPLADVVLAAESSGLVEYMGWLDEEGLLSLMAGAHALVLPSLWPEGMPISALQALSVGTPVVYAGHENLHDVIGSSAGAAFGVGDEGDLAGCLSRLDQLDLMRQHAYDRFASLYSESVGLSNLLEAYETVTRR
ncbi:glycosyltransferase family 4 protein [Nocardioides sp. GY 10127]|uniref:glycosyltransferase family 4 protein n=1 Tax=Nocardioides sp. GY 10127 TaxID=2569762 RepID=UPI0023EF4F72|nr:glycosyltransferase family 4 protein [Nocardioides sp. GY 10127]